MKILIVSGSRAEYGYTMPIIREINKRADIEFSLLVTNMHLIPRYGETVNEYKNEGIDVKYKIYNTLDGYNGLTMAKSLGLFLLQVPEVLEDCKPDIVLIAGDRGEQLMLAIAASHMNIPVAHIQAGEKSGNIDGSVRHSITKLAHIHFASNQDAYNRVIKLGEEPFRVFNTGAPLIDDLLDFNVDGLKEKYGIKPDKDIFLVVNHSVTEEASEGGRNMKILISALKQFDTTEMVIIMPNSDAGTTEICNVLQENILSNFHVFESLSRAEYVTFMRMCTIIIGNTSSGIMEAPTFHKPFINIGRRQKDRYRSNNVIDVIDYNKSLIIDAIHKAKNTEFLTSISNIDNPYGTEKAAPKIVDILSRLEINDKLLNKEISY